jgi:dTMP kinase
MSRSIGQAAVNSVIPAVSVVLEGLDGVGKTTVAKSLAVRLNGRHMSTPPEQMRSYRSWFTSQEDQAMRKAFYMVGNFMAGNDMRSEVEQVGRSMVVDRYYASTMAYILGKANLDKPLPDATDALVAWPTELYRPDYMFVLLLPEADRVARRASRVAEAENDEERLLRESPNICDRINRLYSLFGCIPVNILATETVEDVVDKLMLFIQQHEPCK